MDTDYVSSNARSLSDELHGLSNEQQLKTLIEHIKTAADDQEQSVELAVEAWKYIVSHQTWRANYRRLETLEEELDNSARLHYMIKTYEIILCRKQHEIEGIMREWKCLLQQALPSEMIPDIMGERLLRTLHQLSKVLSKEEAVRQLALAITVRQSKARTRKTPCVSVSDVNKVLQQVSTKTNNHVINAKDNNPSNAPDLEMTDIESEVQGEDGQEEDDEEASEVMVEKGGDGGEDDKEASEVVVEDGGDGGEEGEDGLSSNDSAGNQVYQELSARFSSRRTNKSCRCSTALMKVISHLSRGSALEESTRLELIGEGCRCGLNNLCHLHLRLLAGTAGGLKNNVAGKVLIERLKSMWPNHRQLDRLKEEKFTWFRASNLSSTGLYRFDPRPAPAFNFDAILIFERFAGEGMWSRWINEGTVNVSKFFSYLVGCPAIFSMIEAEFDMYQHHYSPNRDGTMGWLRIMYHSLTQQIIRQDPAYYAITVASRPDKNWRLESFREAFLLLQEFEKNRFGSDSFFGHGAPPS